MSRSPRTVDLTATIVNLSLRITVWPFIPRQETDSLRWICLARDTVRYLWCRGCPLELFRPDDSPIVVGVITWRARVYYVCGRTHFESAVREEARAELKDQFEAKDGVLSTEAGSAEDLPTRRKQQPARARAESSGEWKVMDRVPAGSAVCMGRFSSLRPDVPGMANSSGCTYEKAKGATCDLRILFVGPQVERALNVSHPCQGLGHRPDRAPRFRAACTISERLHTQSVAPWPQADGSRYRCDNLRPRSDGAPSPRSGFDASTLVVDVVASIPAPSCEPTERARAVTPAVTNLVPTTQFRHQTSPPPSKTGLCPLGTSVAPANHACSGTWRTP